MSTLKELLKKHCPDGVEYIKLEDFCSFTAGGDVPKNNFSKEKTTKYNIPIISNGIGANALYGYTNIIKIDEPCISISARGTIGHCIYHEKPFYPIVRLICIIPNDICIPKFLKYFFDNITIDVPKTGIPQLTIPMIKKIYVPVPPIEVQKEIVRILDTFTKYQDLLNRELELRKKQYEYYQNKLLFNSKFDKVKMSDICTVNQGLQIPISQRKKEEGKNRYFYITVQFLKGNNQDKYYIENPSENVICDTDDILVTRTGSTGKIITGVKGCFHNNFFKLNFFDNVNRRYVYYVLSTKKMYEEMLNAASGGTVPDLTHKSFYKLEIYFPPLEEQERIVNILDKFDALCNDITKGLPAEIDMRKKQYEYYRDKLLTFKEKKV